jgi:hypothetical protein
MEILTDIVNELKLSLSKSDYQVWLTIFDFGPCDSLEAVRQKIKQEFPDSEPFHVELVNSHEQEFRTAIQNAFDYCIDYPSRTLSNTSEEKRINGLKQEFIQSLRERFPTHPQFYIYPDEKGIAFYPVYWNFQFIIWQGGAGCLFLYGEAND